MEIADDKNWNHVKWYIVIDRELQMNVYGWCEGS